MDRSSVSRGAQGAAGWGAGGVSPSPPGYGLGRGLYRPRIQQFASLLDLKVEHFGPVFTLYLTEETRTKLQEEEANCLILATPMVTGNI